MSEGTLTQQLAGMNYAVDARNKRWKVNGNAQFSHSMLRSEASTLRTNYLTSGDTYERIQNSQQNKNLKLSDNNDFNYTFRWAQLRVRHSLLFNKFDRTSAMASATTGDTLLNRYYTHGLTHGNDLMTGLMANTIIKFKHNSTDHIEATASLLYAERKDDTFKRYDLYFGNSMLPTRMADQYYRNNPDRNYTFNTSVAYNSQITRSLRLSLNYGLKHTDAHRNSRLYRLDLLNDYERGDLGILPSVAVYESAQDLLNSYESHIATTDHVLTPILSFDCSTSKGRWSGQLIMPLTLRYDRLDYERGTIDTILTHSATLLGLGNTYVNWRSNDKMQRLAFRYRLNPKTPDLLNMVSMRDDTDPLNIHEGNAGLKNSYTHRMSLDYQLTRKRYYTYSWMLNAELTDNAIAMGYTYAPSTGVRTYRAQNVDGNWNIGVRDGFTFRKQRFTLSSALNATHQQHVDLVGISSGMQRSTVKTESLNVLVNANYTWGKHTIGGKMDGSWKYVGSKRTDFSDLNIWNYNYGIIATFQLPLHMQLSTDLTMFSRRGYHEDTINSDDLVWNARLSYTTLRGNLVFVLDGFDILGQLSNVTYTLNGQGRTETRRNVLPQYVLLHMQWRLNKQPKGK